MEGEELGEDGMEKLKEKWKFRETIPQGEWRREMK